jgi:hypothetical protein
MERLKLAHGLRVVVFCLAVGIGILLPAGPADAGYGDAPWSAPFADDYSHSHVTQESNPGDAFFWQGLMNHSFEGDYEPTDLKVWQRSSYISWIDVYWYATPTLPNPAAAADTTCIVWKDSQRCDRFRIRIKEDARYNLSTLGQQNLTCHEIGHTVGFRDGGWNGTSCMTGGNNAILTSFERGEINARY